ncbi:hypothetical protein llg_39920 [Luteolibacter sp. LG18]|nr:hypothetical protein llg_39920 [Luteolibacter sp. LG18]
MHGLMAVCLVLALTGKMSASPAGGATTVEDVSRDAFTKPLANLEGERRSAFFVGNSFFNQNWVAAPASTTARDGLGPLFNTRSCSTCHFKDGRGASPEEGRPFTTALLRISIPGSDPHGGPLPDPIYGGQIQGQALPGVPAEAEVKVSYETISGTYSDGEAYTLRKPVYRMEHPGYGAPSPRLLMSARVAPAMIGLGLLEAVPEKALLDRVDPDDRDHDGISGRVNRVWDVGAKAMAVGRFGWKSEQPSISQQVAAAFQGDMSLTTALFPDENFTPGQEPCASLPNGGSPEVGGKVFDSVVYYSRTLAVPAARGSGDAEVRRGREVFNELRCAACHVPELTTGEWREFPELSGQTIHPYTDLLLHDLGEELDDGRPVFDASGREWRTPPLWGLGLVPKVNGHNTLLHDGRARGVAEAILWHGGEAGPSRDQFRSLPKADREALVRFIESL